ncbi:MAG: hypothetical protein IPI44_00400 [Sulfuritalea sp.]|jgi:hypothetical protein|nr:hypothetical protein [Sulfuritalea sp.]MBK8119289.1 hypothetical protein [Sulfuritalea sp.]
MAQNSPMTKRTLALAMLPLALSFRVRRMPIAIRDRQAPEDSLGDSVSRTHRIRLRKSGDDSDI